MNFVMNFRNSVGQAGLLIFYTYLDKLLEKPDITHTSLSGIYNCSQISGISVKTPVYFRICKWIYGHRTMLHK